MASLCFLYLIWVKTALLIGSDRRELWPFALYHSGVFEQEMDLKSEQLPRIWMGRGDGSFSSHMFASSHTQTKLKHLARLKLSPVWPPTLLLWFAAHVVWISPSLIHGYVRCVWQSHSLRPSPALLSSDALLFPHIWRFLKDGIIGGKSSVCCL